MKVNIKATNLSLTPAIEKAIEEKIANLDKFIPHIDTSVEAWAEVGITSRHHQKGEIYRAEVDIRLPHKVLRSEAEAKNLYQAINIVKDELQRELKKYKEKYQALGKRGGRFSKPLFHLSPFARFKRKKGARPREES